MANEINRQYKNSLFTYMLSHKEYALQVYNALNNTNYINPEEVSITTLENVVFINIRNDVSFILENTFSLYEHQSTYNPNMPLRSLFYIANSYERIIKGKGVNIYGSTLVKIPTPKCVVFYNGEQEYPDKMYLHLSDAFGNQNVEGDVQLRVTMLNINYSHNKKLLEDCEVLRGYSLYNEKFREYNRDESITRTEAANKAIDYCIEHNVLVDFFRNRRNEVVGMILEYTAEQAEKDMAVLEHEISEKEEQIECLGQELSQKEQQVEGLSQELSEKERLLAEKELTITKLLEENDRLKSAK